MMNENDDDTTNDSDGKMNTATTKAMTTTTNELAAAIMMRRMHIHLITCIPTYTHTYIQKSMHAIPYYYGGSIFLCVDVETYIHT